MHRPAVASLALLLLASNLFAADAHAPRPSPPRPHVLDRRA